MISDTEIVHHLDVGNVPPTPFDISYSLSASHKSVKELEYAVNRYGYLIGYSQEQNGKLIHNVFPLPEQSLHQISSSSEVPLELHTELAFHRYKPDYVFLMCLREDPSALTTYAVLSEILTHLSEETISVLRQQWFTTTIDLSFVLNGAIDKTIPITVLSTADNITTFIYDAALIKPINELAAAALESLQGAITKCMRSVALKTGDLLILNNRTVVHGRNSFKPKYDGTDRWLLRALAIKERPPNRFMQGSVCTYTVWEAFYTFKDNDGQ